MAYERHNWECAEVVSAEKLNNIEDGIAEALECCENGGGGGNVLILRATDISDAGEDDAYKKVTTDKTYQEVYDALSSGTLCYLGFNPYDVCTMESIDELPPALFPILYTSLEPGSGYMAYFIGMRNTASELEADSASGYIAFLKGCYV